MKGIVSGILLTLLLLSALTLALSIQRKIVVPDDYSTIQEAITAASAGDVIHVKAGTYFENVVVNKSLSLIGEDKETTVIDGGQAGTVIRVIASNVTVTGFKIQNSGKFDVGIWIEESSHVNVTDNIAINNGVGIYLYNSVDDSISENTVTGNNEGICLTFGGAGTEVRNNIIIHNELNGVTISSDNTSVVNNTLTGNGNGIDLAGYNNTIANNTIAVNECGIILRKCNGNAMYHNNFVKNRQQSNSIESSNAWDNSYPSGGNYWSDYEGADNYSGSNQDQTGSDGIGDKPHIINEDNKDRYPLMKPIFVYEHELAIAVWGPSSIITGTPTTLEVALCNLGLTNETDVRLELLIDGVIVKSETIPEFASSSTYALNHSWSPTIEGVYNITASLIPVPEEYIMINNVKCIQVSVYTIFIGPAKIYFNPSENEVTTGNTFTTEVKIANVTDLYAWQVEIYYSNDILEAIETAEGTFLKTGGPTIWPPPTIANNYNGTHGKIVMGDSLLTDIPGANGGGVLATITFRAKAPGNSTLRIDLMETFVLDSKDERMIFEAVDGYVDVTMGIYGDLNNDEKVNLQDIGVAALAFSSYPGHPRWNPIADINKDNIVNIIDIVFIAMNFGKTQG